MAVRRARRGKGGEALSYRDLESNLLEFSRALRASEYRPDPYRYVSLCTTASFFAMRFQEVESS